MLVVRQPRSTSKPRSSTPARKGRSGRKPSVSLTVIPRKNKRNKGRRNRPRRGHRDAVAGAREVPLPGGAMRTRYTDMGWQSPDAKHFRMALRDPFSIGAVGARVIDSYILPTATYHIRASIKVTTNSTGDAYFALLPSPCFTCVLPATGGGGPTIAGLNPFTQNAQTDTLPGGAYVLSPTALGSVLTEYRTVAWGARILAKDTATSTKGKVYVGMVPTTDNAPSWNTMETVTGTQTSIGEYTIGMPLNSINSVVNLPGVRTFSMQDLLRGEVSLNGVPTNTVFYSFKGTADRSGVAWNTGQVLADEGVFNNTTGLVNSTAGGRKDIASLRGGRAMIFYATGMPPNTNEFDVEIVFHIEGTPNIASAGVTGALMPSSMRSTAGSTHTVETLIAAASAAWNLFKYVRDPLNSAGGTRAIQWVD